MSRPRQRDLDLGYAPTVGCRRIKDESTVRGWDVLTTVGRRIKACYTFLDGNCVGEVDVGWDDIEKDPPF